MPYSFEEIYKLIQSSETISNDDRLMIFEFLAQTFSVIPLRGGFPSPDEISEHANDITVAARKYKAPTERDWSRWCHQKRPFDINSFSPERAGIACGPASKVIVLDIDDMAKFKQWLEDENIQSDLPRTFSVKTGGRGERYHYYFQYPNDGYEYPCRSVKGVFDIRGVGGQVLCPGSLHPSTAKSYTIATNEEIAEAPEWLLEYSLHRKSNKKPNSMIFSSDSEFIATEREQAMNTESLVVSSLHNLFLNDPIISGLPVSDNIKQMIVTSFPVGQRSELSMSVLVALLSNNVDANTIQRIYDKYPIGEKAKEAGSEWFEREVGKAMIHIASEKSNLPNSTPEKKKAAPVSKNYCTMSALDVFSKDIKYEFFIQDFWPKGEPLLITGPGGAGKSIMTLQIAMDLAQSPPSGFLDAFNITPSDHKILFVQSENSLVGINSRLKSILSPQSAYTISKENLKNKIFFLGVNNDIRSVGNVLEDEFLSAIGNAVQKHCTDILVLDPLISFHGQDENSNDQMRRLLDQITVFCESVGTTPLLIHHLGKYDSNEDQGGGRGASAIGDWAPNSWKLKWDSGKKFFVFKHTKARNFKLNDDLQLDLVDLRFRSRAKGVVNSSTQISDVAVRALEKLGGTASSKKELKDAIQALTKSENGTRECDKNVNKMIDDASNAKMITPGPGKTANSIGYSLPKMKK